MSSGQIFGLLSRDGTPVSLPALETMSAAMASEGLGTGSLWRDGTVGLGYLALRALHEGYCEAMPRRDPERGIVLTAHARIDNGEELLAQFGRNGGQPSPGAGQNAPNADRRDSDLIISAFLRWGEECVRHLVGDWALAVWNPRTRRLFVARDPHGISALFYYHDPHVFAFASSIKGLLALPRVPHRPNLFRVAQVLTAWSGDGVQTAYEGISRLPPAHALAVTAVGVQPRQYWQLECVQPLRLGSDADYEKRFLELYRQAVASRLRGAKRVGVMLSSGLDSGSVAALAAYQLRSRGARLLGLTSVPIYGTDAATPRGWYGDESPLVESERAHFGNLDVHHVRAETISPLAGVERALALHAEPCHAADNQFWLHAVMRAARHEGIDVLLTGQAGNGTISWWGGVENFWPLLWSGRWRTLSRAWRTAHVPAWRIARRHLAGPVFVGLRGRVRRWRYPFGEPWKRYSAINVRFAQELRLTQRMYAGGHDPAFDLNLYASPRRNRCRMIEPGVSIFGGMWADIGADYGLEVRDPTLDTRLMEFCLAVPDAQYRGHGYDRWLIRRAMQGLLPDTVRLNVRRGRQAADLGHRVLASLPECRSVVERLRRSDLARGVLDVPRLSRVLEALQHDVNAETSGQCSTILMPGVMAGMFLLQFS